MGKKKAVIGLEPGTLIRVKAGVMAPEFPEISLAGWSGSVVETSGKPPAMFYIVEWDQLTIDTMPAEYVQQCEAQQLYYVMANLPEAAIELVS